VKRNLSLDLSLLFESPLLSVSSGVEEAFVDRSAVRATDGTLVLPASSLKGRWRHACEQVLRTLGSRIPVCEAPRPDRMCSGPDLCPACALFGCPARPSRLRFRDLRTETRETAIRHGVSLNRRRRQAEEGRLFVVETSPTRLILQAAPAVTGRVEAAELALLLAALRQVPAWGSGRTRGLGWASCQVRGRWGEQEFELAEGKERLPFGWEVLGEL
jgi:CRISPR/Cas system CSM-associated protein Csm3 (group 7 of RAMP superfamily)